MIPQVSQETISAHFNRIDTDNSRLQDNLDTALLLMNKEQPNLLASIMKTISSNEISMIEAEEDGQLVDYCKTLCLAMSLFSVKFIYMQQEINELEGTNADDSQC